MNASNLSDTLEKRLIELAQKGDLDAFNQLVLAYQDIAFRLASWMFNDDAMAEDIVQSAFLAAYNQIKNLRGRSFRAWLLKIIHNLSIDEIRRRKLCHWIPLEPENSEGQLIDDAAWLVDPASSPEDACIERESWKKIAQFIQQLADPLREVLVLIDIEDLNYREAATILNVPIGTIRSRLWRARAFLRAVLMEPTISNPKPYINCERPQQNGTEDRRRRSHSPVEMR